jgi:FMN-dependent NADH-azoreductase
MGIVLHIEASPKGERSVSSRIAQAFLDAYAERRPQDEIRTLNVWTHKMPEFDRLAVESKSAVVERRDRTPDEAALWEIVRREISYFDQAEKLVISSPMWNYTIPYRLKHYLDIIVQPGETFGFDMTRMAHVGLLKNRPAKLILTRSSARAGAYYDFQLPYLTYILAHMGIHEVSALTADQTFGLTAAQREAYIEQFCRRARTEAGAFDAFQMAG